MIPHETLLSGPAADLAGLLSASIPVLDTERCRLRAPRLSDMDAWTEVLCGPATEHLGGPFTRDAAFATTTGLWLLRGRGLCTVVSRDGQVLGFVLIGFEPGDEEPELGYLVRPIAQGQGLACEAAIAARDVALKTLRLPSLVSYVAEDNAPSNTLAARLGARLGARADGVLSGCTIWRYHPAPRQGAIA